jgi:hypothetical protein
MIIPYVMLLGLVCGGFCAALAGEKNRNGTAWFFLGAFFSIVALLTLVGMPMKAKKSHVESLEEAIRALGEED